MPQGSCHCIFQFYSPSHWTLLAILDFYPWSQGNTFLENERKRETGVLSLKSRQKVEFLSLLKKWLSFYEDTSPLPSLWALILRMGRNHRHGIRPFLCSYCRESWRPGDRMGTWNWGKLQRTMATTGGHCVPMGWPGMSRTNKVEVTQGQQAPLSCSQQRASLLPPNST